ncbi:MAG TPA: NAD(P)/FAD-dependent oxidoreductase [Opitutaceae bacterium]|nr:NAD(P)/FAD-dependent oxidoreductase [Opitutaceae bacterium]
MNSNSHYDVAIIGAGMSGLAAGIRLAHFGKKVCIFERHNAIGGLNSFYSIAGRKFDVGLHAMTNYVPPGTKGTPLGKLLRQLRIERDEFGLFPQKRSRIAFGQRGETSLTFTNDASVLQAEVARVFPAQIDGFRKLIETVRRAENVAIDAPIVSARETVRQFITDRLLEEMLFCPMMYYGSPQERDMAFRDFAVLFQSIFLEGFARPLEGVRVVLRVLLEKYRAAGGERRMKCGVQRIITRDKRAAALVLDTGEEITADHVLSSIGYVETEKLYREPQAVDLASIGRLSFVEAINVLDCPPADLGWGEDTIVFFNEYSTFHYERPAGLVDLRSGVICLPNNFDFSPGHGLPEGVVRCTCLANYTQWKALDEAAYAAEKERAFAAIVGSAQRFLPPLPSADVLREHTIATDVFTPLTIERFTGHLEGSVYGSPRKIRDGSTGLSNLYLCGTDQGYLGITGSMLSGISMANMHVLQKS